MQHTKIFIELLAPLFIAILTLGALAALIKWQITPAAIGLGGLGAAGLITILISGVIADLWTRRHATLQIKSQAKNR